METDNRAARARADVIADRSAAAGAAAAAMVGAQMDTFCADLRLLVEAESPTSDVDLLSACAQHVAAVGARRLGRLPSVERTAAGPVLRWSWPGKQAGPLLLGHYDTVWPEGTLGDRPFTLAGDVVTGPGVFDMKAGIVHAFAALEALEDLAGVTLLLTCDEETGSAATRTLIEEATRAASAVLVCEPAAPEGALKVARKGVSMYQVGAVGRAAHAGLEPHDGRNATVAAARLIEQVCGLGDGRRGTTVTPTTIRGGDAANVVPSRCDFAVDVRASTAKELRRVDEAIRELRSDLPDIEVLVTGGVNRGAMEASAELVMVARSCALALGQDPPAGVAVGGASDANLAAAVGASVLDGLGAVGGGAHAVDEWVDLRAVPERVGLLAALTAELILASNAEQGTHGR